MYLHIWLVEARELAKRPTMLPAAKQFPDKMSIVLNHTRSSLILRVP